MLTEKIYKTLKNVIKTQNQNETKHTKIKTLFDLFVYVHKIFAKKNLIFLFKGINHKSELFLLLVNKPAKNIVILVEILDLACAQIRKS